MADDSKQILAAIARLEGRFEGLDRDVKAAKKASEDAGASVTGLKNDMNGRFKKIEHTVFGDEESNKIGLTEKMRGFDEVAKIVVGDEKEGILSLPERLRNLESGWAKLTTVAVFACSIVIEGVKFGWHVLSNAGNTGVKPHP